MNNQAKKTLLERKFTSIIYMEIYVQHFIEMVEAFEQGMNAFRQIKLQHPNIDEHNFSEWETREFPILDGDKNYAIDALEIAKKGNPSRLRSSASNLRGLSRDVDNIGGFGDWWNEIDEKYWDDFWIKLKLAKQTGSNIDYTISGYWDDDEILDEEITGLINEQELLNYLKPNEKLADIS